MAKRLVKKAAPAVVETTEEKPYPEQSPGGADLVFVDDQGIAHYQDGVVFELDTPEGDEEPVSPDEEEEAPEDVADDGDVDGEPEEEHGKHEAPEGDEPADEEPVVEKSAVPVSDPSLVALDALRLSAALVEQVQEIFTNTELSKRESAYEQAMLNFNRVMDTAAIQNWLVGSTVSKRDNSEAVTEAVEAISKTYTNVVESVGGTPVSKKDDETVDIYKGLTPEAAEIVRKSAEVLEERETEKWEAVAKGFKNVPGDKSKLGAALRALNETDPEKYAAVAEALGAADSGLADNAVFKSFGVAGDDTPTSITKRAEALVAKGDFKTVDEAELHLMEQDPAAFYKPTNA